MEDNQLTEAIIGAAIEVHKRLGPGLLESIYEEALCYELSRKGLRFKRQESVPIMYRDVRLASDLRLDLIVEGRVIIEIKAKEVLSPIDKPQLLSYLRLTGRSIGLLINFNVPVLKAGIHRVVNNFEQAAPQRTS